MNTPLNKTRKSILILITITTLGFLSSRAYSYQNTDSDAKFVEQQLLQLRINNYFQIEAAEKKSDHLYEVKATGMGVQNIASFLYWPSTGGWVFLFKTEDFNRDIYVIEKPVFLFTSSLSQLNLDSNTPTEILNYLSDYHTAGSIIELNPGANITGLWYPDRVGGLIGDLIQDMGLTRPEFLTANKFRDTENALLIRGSYNYLAQGDVLVNFGVEIASPPPFKNLPDGLKIKDEAVNLVMKCKITASLDFFKSSKAQGKNGRFHFDQTECESKVETDVRVDINGDQLYFNVGAGFKTLSYANSKAFAALAKETGINPNRAAGLFIEGDIQGGIWKNIFGVEGFTLDEVKLQALMINDVWSIGIFGETQLGSANRLEVAAVLPTEGNFQDVSLMASLEELNLEELALLPSVIGGPKAYPQEWINGIKNSGLSHFGLRDLKFTFAPEMGNPDLGIDQSGTTVTATVYAFGTSLSSTKIYANEDGIYFDDATQPFKIGWFEVKNARFKGFIPSKSQKDSEENIRARKKLDYVKQNAFVLFFDTFIEIEGNKERALVSFSPLNAGIEFDANITKDIGVGITLRLPVANIAKGEVPFDVSGYFHDGGINLSKEVRKAVTDNLADANKQLDQSYAEEHKKIKAAQHKLDSLKTIYEKNRAAAQARYDAAVAPLKHAESVLNSKESYADHLESEAKHWKHKAKHYHWYEFSKIAHAYYEEGKYWTEYGAYKAVVEAAKLAVRSLEETTHFISVDADPLVVESFSEYNGARFGLALAEGALTAAQKATTFVLSIPSLILNDTFASFVITHTGITGKATGPGNLGVQLDISGTVYGTPWTITPDVTLASAESAANVTAQNLEAIAKALAPMSGTLIANTKSTYKASDYAKFPPGAQLAYKWESMPGYGADIAAGDQTIFVNNSHGYIYKWNHQDSLWNRFIDARKVKHLDAKGNGDLLVVNTDGILFYRNNRTNRWVPDRSISDVHDVGIGEDGTIWVTTRKLTRTRDPYTGQSLNTSSDEINEFSKLFEYSIYRKKAGQHNWTKMPGTAVRVDVDKDGNAWVINHDYHIYRWKGDTANTWENVKGEASDVGLGGGQVWVVNKNGYVYHFIPGNEEWVRITGLGANISVDGNGHLWLVNKEGHIYRNLGPR